MYGRDERRIDVYMEHCLTVNSQGKTEVIKQHNVLLLLLLLLIATELSLGGSGPYTSTNKTNKN
jgi:hypothetical protein